MRIPFLLAGIALSFATSRAQADTLLTYTGQNFSSVISPLTTADSLSGHITILAPLPNNSFTYVNSTGSPAQAIDPIAWSFTDGVRTYDQTDSLLVSNFTTNTSGAITSWGFTLLGSYQGGPISFYSSASPTPAGNYDVISTMGISVATSKGSFTESTAAPAPTPEPSSMALLLTGGLGIACLARRRLRQSTCP